MHILIMGGTGFVGHALTRALRAAGHTVAVCTRKATPGPSASPSATPGATPSTSPSATASAVDQGISQDARPNPHVPQDGFATWDGAKADTLRPLLHHVNVVVNLQGENIGASRWTQERRRALLHSRLTPGHALQQAVSDRRIAGEGIPHTLLQASACGYYGLWHEDAPRCTEDGSAGSGFLAEICAQWEGATAGVESLGVRRCVLRLSPVLGRDAHGAPGGFVQRMATPYRYFVGGPAGAGLQPVSWVHMDDVCAAALFLLERPYLQGAFNLCAPHCPNMNEFSRTLGLVLHRPALLRVPAFVLRLALGDMADELVLAGQHSVPARLTAAGYVWRHPELQAALAEVFNG